jgi:hypothetical protein
MKKNKDKIVYILQICEFLKNGDNRVNSTYGVYSSLAAAKIAMFDLKDWAGPKSRKKLFWKIVETPIDKGDGWVFFHSAYSPHHFARIDKSINNWEKIIMADKMEAEIERYFQ